MFPLVSMFSVSIMLLDPGGNIQIFGPTETGILHREVASPIQIHGGCPLLREEPGKLMNVIISIGLS